MRPSATAALRRGGAASPVAEEGLLRGSGDQHPYLVIHELSFHPRCNALVPKCEPCLLRLRVAIEYLLEATKCAPTPNRCFQDFTQMIIVKVGDKDFHIPLAFA